MHAIDMIKSWIGRRDINKSELARRLGVSHTWVTNRLAGHQEIGLAELERIAEALDVEIAELLPRTADRRANDTTIYSRLAADGTPLAAAGPIPAHPIGPHIPTPRPGSRSHHRADAHPSGRRHHPTVTAGEHRTGRAHRPTA